MSVSIPYKDILSEEKRKLESQRVLERYPSRLPIIVERTQNNDPTLPDIDKKKFLVPFDLTVGQFFYVVRKRLKLAADQALFFYAGGELAPPAELMGSLYKKV